MNADLIGGIVIGVFSILAVIVFKNWFWELYSEVCDLRKERTFLRDQLKNITRDIYSTQEEVNLYYEWKKERNKG